MRLRTVVALLVVFSAVAVASSAITYLPTSTPYSVFNTGPDGFSRAAKELGVVYSLEEVAGRAEGTALVVLSASLGRDTMGLLKDYVYSGGTLIVLYDINATGPRPGGLLEGLVAENATVVDNTYHAGPAGDTPYAWFVGMGHVRVALHRPSPLIVEGGGWEPLALTSPFSFKDLDGDGARDPFEAEDRYVVAACRGVGRGRVCVVSSPSLLSNRLLDVNRGFLNLLNGTTLLYIDPGTLPPVDRLKLAVRRASSQTLFAALLTALSLVSGLYVRGVRLTKLYHLILAASTLLALATVFTGGGWEPLALLGLAYTSALLGRHSLALAGLASLLLYLGHHPLLLLAALPLYAAYPLALGVGVERPPSDVLGSSTEASLRIVGVLAPATVAYPMSIPSLAALLLAISAVSLARYAWLRSVRVKVPGSFEAVLGREAAVPVVIEADGPVRVYAWIGRGEVVAAELPGGGVGMLSIPYRPRRLGVHTERIEVVIEDSRGLASRRQASEVVFRVVPSVSILLQRVSTWLGPLVEYVGRVVERRVAEAGLLLRGARGAALGRAVGARGAGVSGAGGRIGAEGMGRGGEGEGERGLRGAEGAGAEEEGFAEGRVVVIVLGEGVEGMASSRRGVYYGARFYVPGDSPKDIHWKKTVSRRRLVVKTYSAEYGGGGGGGGGRGGGGGVAVVADLEASSEEELDGLAYRLLSYLAYGARRTPWSRAVVYLTLPNGSTLVLSGSFKSVLAGLVYLFRRGMVRIDAEYLSQGVPLEADDLEKVIAGARQNRLFRAMLLANGPYVRSVVEALRGAGVSPPSGYILIHGSPSSFKNSYLDYVLSSLGYKRLEWRGA